VPGQAVASFVLSSRNRDCRFGERVNGIGGSAVQRRYISSHDMLDDKFASTVVEEMDVEETESETEDVFDAVVDVVVGGEIEGTTELAMGVGFLTNSFVHTCAVTECHE
jgi:hypothetical protein